LFSFNKQCGEVVNVSTIPSRWRGANSWLVSIPTLSRNHVSVGSGLHGIPFEASPLVMALDPDL